MPIKIQYGVDQLIMQPAAWRQKNIALVTNDAALTTSGMPSRVALLKAGFHLTTLFSPEHGISRTGEDGALQPSGMDELTGLPIISLYGDKLAPAADDLDAIDIVLFDIPDIGCRFYTYLWTMTQVMEACAKHQKELIILDRPNPIGGVLVNAEGPMLHPACSSFIGRWNIPLKHACTLGELARYFAATQNMKLALQVIPVQEYRRSFTALQELDFVPTSPAMTNSASAFFYPGTGLLEGINVNEGRGTDTPFTVLGAPWLNAAAVLELLLPNTKGFTASVTIYTPASGLYAGERCNGIALQLTEPDKLMAVQTGLHIIQSILKVHPQSVQERLYPTVANPTGKGHLDRLLGLPGSFDLLLKGAEIDTRLYGEWEEKMLTHLLY